MVTIPKAFPPLGTKLTTTPVVDQTSVPNPPVNAAEDVVIDYPFTLPNGDILLNEVEYTGAGVYPILHHAKLLQLTDPGQKYPYIMKCSCGSEARCYTEDELYDNVYVHMNRRAVIERPK